MKEQYETYKPITLLKKVIGTSLITLGLITFPLPTGSIVFIIAGCGLLSIDHKKLLFTFKFYSRKLIDWLYGNRNIKLIKYNIHRSLIYYK